MSNVVAMPGHSLPSAEPDQGVMELLEEAMERAKSGKLQGIAIVMVERDPETFETVYHAHQGRHTLAAGIMSLSWQIGRRMSESEQ